MNELRDKFNIKTVAQFALLLVMFLLAAFLASGIDLNWERVWSWVFAGILAIRLIMMITAYNASFAIDTANRRSNKKSIYYSTAYTYKKRVEAIYNESLHDVLAEAVKRENADRLKAAQNRAVREIHGRLSWDELEAMLQGESAITVEELAEHYKLSGKKYKKFCKAVHKILNGDIKYEAIEEDDIRVDRDGAKENEVSLKDRAAGFFAFNNLKQILTFLAFNILTSVIMYVGGDSNIWIEIAKNAVLFLSSVTAGMAFAQRNIKRRTAMLEARNNFMQKRMAISVAWEYKDS